MPHKTFKKSGKVMQDHEFCGCQIFWDGKNDSVVRLLADNEPIVTLEVGKNKPSNGVHLKTKLHLDEIVLKIDKGEPEVTIYYQ